MKKMVANDETGRFKELLKEKKESSLIVSNKDDIENASNEGRTIVLKNNPLGILLLYGIILVVFLAMIIIMSLTSFNIPAIITLFSVWGVSFLIAITVVLTHTIILHPEGFLLRKRIFHTFSQKWISLTSKPETSIITSGTGGKYYVLKFIGSWGSETIGITAIKIKDLRNHHITRTRKTISTICASHFANF